MQLPDTLPGTGLNVKIKKEFGEPEEELADPSPEITVSCRLFIPMHYYDNFIFSCHSIVPPKA